MEDEEFYEMMLKVVLVGDSGVGKTNIMGKYLKNEFHEDSKATVGVEFGAKTFKIEGHSIRAQIWDTAGQERYKAITSTYYKGAKGAFVIFDITRKSSFESIDKWVNDLVSSADQKLTIVLIGNKNDLENQREITKEQGEAKASSLQIAYLETSALSGANIDKAFEMMVNEVYKKCHDEMASEGDVEIFGGQDIKLNNNTKTQKKKCC